MHAVLYHLVSTSQPHRRIVTVIDIFGHPPAVMQQNRAKYTTLIMYLTYVSSNLCWICKLIIAKLELFVHTVAFWHMCSPGSVVTCVWNTHAMHVSTSLAGVGVALYWSRKTTMYDT